jgi:hypothetical protein
VRVCDALQCLAEHRGELNPSQFFLLTELVFRGNGELEVPCSSRELARSTGLCRDTIQRTIDTLTTNRPLILDVCRGTGAGALSIFRLKFLAGPNGTGPKIRPTEDREAQKSGRRWPENQADGGPKIRPAIYRNAHARGPTDLPPEKQEFMKSVQGLLGSTIRDPKTLHEIAYAPEAASLCERSFRRWLQGKVAEWKALGKLKSAPGLLRKAIRDGELVEWARQETYSRLRPDEDMEAAERRWRAEEPTPPPRIPPASADEIRSLIAEVAAAKRMR